MNFFCFTSLAFGLRLGSSCIILSNTSSSSCFDVGNIVRNGLGSVGLNLTYSDKCLTSYSNKNITHKKKPIYI